MISNVRSYLHQSNRSQTTIMMQAKQFLFVPTPSIPVVLVYDSYSKYTRKPQKKMFVVAKLSQS